ncbi:hypothetical protein [Tissierella sp.]|uniref:hypothetical protein n=1 Tax=Tissierella sp. TaxID=41274 RepID=UPI0028AA136A|nr:hypothetical protein [Tissierella sp.]
MVLCDECKKDFTVNIKTEELNDNIEKVYFVCPHCNKEYTSYYTNVLIKKKQIKMRNIKGKIGEFKGINPKKAMNLYKQYEKLKKELSADMEKLRKIVEGD